VLCAPAPSAQRSRTGRLTAKPPPSTSTCGCSASSRSNRDNIDLAELCTLLGSPRHALLRALHEPRENGLFPGLTIVYDDNDHPDDAVDRGDDINAVTIIRSTGRPRRNPTLGLGLDELGRFAYTVGECQDRLDLISTALTDRVPDNAPDLRRPLENARDELEGWQGALHAAAARSGAAEAV
jgi:hypothetical protein